MLQDSDPITFGAYKGTPLSDVPDTYLLWCYGNVNRTSDKKELFEYLDDNIDAIRKNVEDEKRRSAYPLKR